MFKAQCWVFDALQEIRARLSFDLKGIDSNNGSEFINAHLVAYCQKEALVFTRSWSYQKNDNCHVEQKNFKLQERLHKIIYEKYKGRPIYTINRIKPVLA